MILYIENPRDSTKKLLETINKYSKFAGHKIRVQNLLHSCILTVKFQKRTWKKTISFAVTTKRTNHPGIILTKDMKDVYTEN